MGVGYLTGQGGGVSNIKSIQRGLLASQGSVTTYDININAINLDSSIVTYKTHGTLSDSRQALMGVQLIDDRTIRVTSGTSSVFGGYWEVIEFKGVKSKQSGINSIDTATGIVPISPVNTQKSLLFYSYSTASFSTQIGTVLLPAYISSSTEITAISGYIYQKYFYWQVIEFN